MLGLTDIAFGGLVRERHPLHSLDFNFCPPNTAESNASASFVAAELQVYDLGNE